MQQAAAKNAMAFKSKCLDVNFDLENSEYRAIQNIGTGQCNFYEIIPEGDQAGAGLKFVIKGSGHYW